VRTLADIETGIAEISATPDAQAAVDELLRLSEEIVEHWIVAKGEIPGDEKREGFRLLGLHRQGARGDPSFNACRETCREIVYYYNLISMQPELVETTNRLAMMKMISKHLYLFISGKMQAAALGDFCCSSRPVRLTTDIDTKKAQEA
jgi:hypothetical protein